MQSYHTLTLRGKRNNKQKNSTDKHMLLIPLRACTNTRTHKNHSRLWSFSCHDLNSCSKASSSHPSTTTPQPHPLFFFFSLALISPRMKVTFLSLHPSARTLPRSGLTAAHSRQCQAEIILSVKLSNEARHTHAPKNKHTLEL